jgi:hypothetical protein
MPLTFTKYYKLMESEQWVEHKFLSGLNDIKVEEMLWTTKHLAIWQLQELIQM